MIIPAQDYEKHSDILFVTAEESLAEQIIKTLSETYNLDRARNYTQALSHMAFSLPSLIIVDTDLPDRSGLDLLKTIRGSIKTKLIPIIMMTRQDNNPLKSRIETLESGADDCILFPFQPEELIVLIQSRLNKFKEFYLLSITDELTRLYNRREFIKKFQDEINRHPEKILSVAILDIDYFKHVNDTYGHQTGDKVLMELAEILKKNTSEYFFPARFGGEEFVILFPFSNSEDARDRIETILDEFASLNFEAGHSTFHVTFSAGISEYPGIARNVSELLSRADQALYTAKDEGRNRIYIFSPIMARNDKFWEYLRSRKGMFVDTHSCDAVTGLPFLPQLLETISGLDFIVKSIGILVIRLNPVQSVKKYFGPMNFQFDVENIRISIEKSCELIFPSDTYIGLSDFFSYEFTVLFPSVVDFSFNLEKFHSICEEIGNTLNRVLSEYYVDMTFSSGVISIDRSNPRNIYTAIDAVRTKGRKLSIKAKKFAENRALFEKNENDFDFSDYFTIRKYYPMEWDGSPLLYFSMNEKVNRTNAFGALIQSLNISPENLASFFNKIDGALLKKHSGTMLFNLPSEELWENPDRFLDYVRVADMIFPDNNKIILLNEYALSEMDTNGLLSIQESMPSHISLGLNNCYIGNDILSIISRIEFSMIFLSESITRNLHLFKNRIKIISGLKIFLDQVGIPLCAKNIRLEEEYQVIRDLRLSYISGSYIEAIADHLL